MYRPTPVSPASRLSPEEIALALSHTAIVGGGAVARSFAHALTATGLPPLAIACRSLARACALAGALQTAVPPAAFSLSDPPPTPKKNIHLVIVAVTDSALPAVAAALPALFPSASYALHTSGALPAAALHPAAPSVLGLHPAAPFQVAGPPTPLRGVLCALDAADPRGAALGTALARRLGMEPFALRSGGGGDDAKAAYHAACCMAAGGAGMAVAAAAAALDRAAGGAVDREVAARLVGELARKAIEAVVGAVGRGEDPVGVLTGPVFRGDASVVRRHAGALGRASDSDEDELGGGGGGNSAAFVSEFYSTTTRAMADAALRSRRIDQEAYEGIVDALSTE